LQLALYQQYYCQVAHGWAWAVTITVTEQRAALMAQIAHLFRPPLTGNMVNTDSPPHMVPMDMMPAPKPDASVALMVQGHTAKAWAEPQDTVNQPCMVRLDMGKLATGRLDMAKPHLDRPDTANPHMDKTQ